MDAIIADIHGNLEALHAVLRVIHHLKPDRIICLGDLVGYGPDPLECLRHSREWDILIAGEWDQAILEHDPNLWSPEANHLIDWVRQEIDEASDSSLLLEILTGYDPRFQENGICYSHGTPHDPREWIFPEDVYNTRKMNRIATEFERVLFCGHSHIAGIYQLKSEMEWDFIEPIFGKEYEIDAEKEIISVGSIGQPRDGDPRACFVTIDWNRFQFHRVDYDVDKTIQKIHNIPAINNLHGDRLREGR